MIEVKVCGIKGNAREVAALNIDYMGLIFAPSPRQVSIDEALELSKIIRENGKKAVGVFVDESDENIVRAAREANLNVAQIHKSIGRELFYRLKGLNLGVWQVISVGERLQIPAQIHADLVLFDAKGSAKGGNGVAFEWGLLKDYGKDFALAGGIDADNAKMALQTGAKILDINSRFEKEPGVKDVQKIELFLKEIGR